jgi:hypothetical protein
MLEMWRIYAVRKVLYILSGLVSVRQAMSTYSIVNQTKLKVCTCIWST